MIDEVVDDAVNAILEEEDATGAEKVVQELKELEEKVVGAAVATLTEERRSTIPPNAPKLQDHFE